MAKKLEKSEVSSCKTCECWWECNCKKCCCLGKILLSILTILWVVAAIMACFYSFKSYQLNALSAWGTENMNKMIEMYKSDAYVKQATERTDTQVSSFLNSENNIEEDLTEQTTYTNETLSADEVSNLKSNGVIYGPENAKITILEFADASCGYCKRQVAQDKTIDAVMAQYPDDVNMIFKNFPIFNETAAEAMACAEDYLTSENYHQYVIAVFWAEDASNVEALASLAANYWADSATIAECVNNGTKADEVSATMNEWQSFGITWTPSSVIINNESGEYELVPGAYPAETFIEAIQNLLS